MPHKYHSVPETVTAMQYNGDNTQDVADWFRGLGVAVLVVQSAPGKTGLHNNEGEVVPVGSYAVAGSSGTFWWEAPFSFNSRFKLAAEGS